MDRYRAGTLVYPLHRDLQSTRSCSFRGALLALIQLLTGDYSDDSASARLEACLSASIAFCNSALDVNTASGPKDTWRECAQEARSLLEHYAKPTETRQLDQMSCLVDALNSILRAFRFSNIQLGLDNALGSFEFMQDGILFNRTTDESEVHMSRRQPMDRKPPIISAAVTPLNAIHGVDHAHDDWETCSRVHAEDRAALNWSSVFHCWDVRLSGLHSSVQPLRELYDNAIKHLEPARVPTLADLSSSSWQDSFSAESDDSIKSDEWTIYSYRLHPIVQCAVYGLQRLNSSPGLTHAINLLVNDNVVYLWWYDREGCIQTCGLDFIENLPYLVVLLIILQRFREQHWGKPPIFHDPDSILINEHSFRIHRNAGPVHHYYKLIGRGTYAVDALGPEEELTMMKISWPEEGRQNEVDIIRHAHDSAKAGLSNPSMVLDHIPIVIASIDIGTTALIRKLLHLDSARTRQQRVIVFRRLELITSLRGDDFWEAYWQIIRCHGLLWHLGLQHGDISVGNLMYDRRRKSGVLNDFDLSRVRGISETSGVTGAATMPFMALDLLSPEWSAENHPILYRHELESFMWVLAWVCCCFQGGKEKVVEPFDSWLSLDCHTCRAAKTTAAMDLFKGHDGGKDYPNLMQVCRSMGLFWMSFRLYRNYACAKNSDAGFEPHPGREVLKMLLDDVQQWKTLRYDLNCIYHIAREGGLE